MHAYMIDGTCKKRELSSETIAAVLKNNGWNTRMLTVRNASVLPCTACNGCSERRIGECVIQDDGAEIAEHAATSDLFIILSEVTFGGLSSLAKRAFERTLPNILPYFTMYRKELHHVLRYPRRPHMLFLGWLPEPDEQQEILFHRFTERSAVNFMTTHKTVVFHGCHIQEQLEEVSREIYQLSGGGL